MFIYTGINNFTSIHFSDSVFSSEKLPQHNGTLKVQSNWEILLKIFFPTSKLSIYVFIFLLNVLVLKRVVKALQKQTVFNIAVGQT